MYKIGLCNDSFPPMIDGVSNAVVNYATIIQKKFGEAVVITPRYPYVEDDYDFKVCRYHSLKFGGDMPYRVGNPFSPFAIRKVKKEEIDLLHVHSPFASSVMAMNTCRGRKGRIPVVLTYHTKFEIDLNRYIKNRPFKFISKTFVKNNIRRADEVWVVSKGSIDSLRYFGYKGPIRLMPNGTDFPKGKAPEEDIREIDRLYGTEGCENVFIYCGRMQWYKNIKLIIDALKRVKENGLSFKMLMVGDGTDRVFIEQYVKRMGLKKDIIFTGPIYDRDRVRAFFSRADLQIFPSTYDTSGLVVIEAAACECASILMKGSCAAEGIIDGVDGVLCKQDHSGALARAILRATADPKKLKALGHNAQTNLYRSWDDAVEQAFNRYCEIIEEVERIGWRAFRKAHKSRCGEIIDR